MLGRYEVIRHLASGGMADLLLARARGLEGFEHHVVIKRIRADAENDQAFIEMFLIEARLAGALHHHNIVQVHDIGEENGKPYFAMEYIHGEDVRRLLSEVVRKGEQVPVPILVAIVTAVARALHHAHEQRGSDQKLLGIVHRDVSPANIVVGYDGNVKVLDFGIARAAMRRTETQAGMLKGKAPYMAPEQCTGASVDRRSDVFGLGIVLYELATARRLFKADNDHLTMRTIVDGTIPAPSTIRKDLPPDLEQIILRALARDPGARYQTAEQMFTALEQLALAAEWRTSASAVAAYMTQMFGSRTEPWLASEPTATVINVDFDGAVPGIASPPADPAKPSAPKAITKGVPKAAETAATSPIKIPEASGPKTSTTAATAKPAALAPVTATPRRAKPKTVQVPVVSTAKPAANGANGANGAKVPAKVGADAKPAAVADPSGESTEILPARLMEDSPAANAEPKPRAETEELIDPIIVPEETHTQAMPLPPAISPHAARQLKPLPPPKVAKTFTPKPIPRLTPQPGDTAAAAPSPIAAESVAAPPTVMPPTVASPAPPVVAGPPAAVSSKNDFADIPSLTAVEIDESTEISAIPLAPIFSPSLSSPTPSPSESQEQVFVPLPSPDPSSDPSPSSSPPPSPFPFQSFSSPSSDPTPFAAPSPYPAPYPYPSPSGPLLSSPLASPRERFDPTALVAPLPPPARRTDASERPDQQWPTPNVASMSLPEDSDQHAASRRPPWVVPAIGGGLVVLLIIVIAIARSGGDDARDSKPETAVVTEPPKPAPAPAPADEVRNDERPRTWANSQQPDTAGSAETPPPVPAATAPIAADTAGPTTAEPAAITKPATTEPATTQPATTKPAVAITKPATTKPATTEPATTQPATTKPAVSITKPATTKPATTQPTTAKPGVAITKPATTKPATTKPATTNPATTKPATTQPTTAITKPATTKPATTKPATTKPATTKPATTKPATTTAKPAVAKPAAIGKTTKPATTQPTTTKAVAKPAPKPAPAGKTTKPAPKPKWNPNTLFPNKK